MKTAQSTVKHPQIHQMTVTQFEALFPDETACRTYLQVNRWPDGVCCPRCGNPDVKVNSHHKHHWNCYACSPDGVGYRFSVLVGTIFENTNKPLRQWFRVMHMMLTSKKGVSALQVYRVMGFGSYRTALNMCNKIRVALGDNGFKQLVGYVEVDETFVGGKAKNKHKGPGGKGGGGQGGSGKAIIIGAAERGGNVIARAIESIDTKTVVEFVREVVSHKVSLISTDEASAYKTLSHKERFPWGYVTHSRGEYVQGAVHTNTIEGFWSMVKRGIVGTYHKVSAKYLPLYVNEFEFRYNNRKNPDIFGTAIRAC
jgi:transposase-like protein